MAFGNGAIKMNNERRKMLAKAFGQIQRSAEIIENIKCEEQDCYDRMPENFQDSLKGEKVLENVEVLEDCIDSLENFLDEFTETIKQI